MKVPKVRATLGTIGAADVNALHPRHEHENTIKATNSAFYSKRMTGDGPIATSFHIT